LKGKERRRSLEREFCSKKNRKESEGKRSTQREKEQLKILSIWNLLLRPHIITMFLWRPK